MCVCENKPLYLFRVLQSSTIQSSLQKILYLKGIGDYMQLRGALSIYKLFIN